MKKTLVFLFLTIALFLVGCYVPLKPYLDKNYNGYKKIDDISNIENVQVFRYASLDAIPQHINETTELIGDASWQAGVTPDNRDIEDMKEYARRVGADVVVFVFSENRSYAGSYTTYYKYTNSSVSTPTYSSNNFWYVGFRRTIK